MEESSHTWLKYTCRMCKVCLFISFFARLFHVQPTCPIWQKRHTFFLYHCHLHNVSKLTCYAARRNIVRNVTIKKKSYHVFHRLYFSKKPIIIALIKISRRYLLNSPNIILVGIVLLKPRTDVKSGEKVIQLFDYFHYHKLHFHIKSVQQYYHTNLIAYQQINQIFFFFINPNIAFSLLN